MKNKIKQLTAALMTGILCMTLLGACSSKKQNRDPVPSSSLETESFSQETDLPENTYLLPEMGMAATLPEELLEQMEQGEVNALINEIATDDGSALRYGYLSWFHMNDSQQELDTVDWEKDTQFMGILGVYQADLVHELDQLTGCDQHQELGQSADGSYKYYLSTNSTADEALTRILYEIQVTVTEMAALDPSSDPDDPQTDFTGTNVGEFSTQDINGNTYTNDIFKDYQLTMVNIFTTWCNPCVAEMPDLEKLYQQVSEQGVNVVGIVLDVLDEKGAIDPESLERAQLLVERTGVTYPILLPDSTYMNGRLADIQAFPETFFIDKDGNVVGGTYTGSNSLENWLEVVQEELAALQESN